MEPKSFSSLSGAKAAIKKAGLDGVPHHFAWTFGGRVRPVFTPDLEEDREYLRSKHWDARKPAAALKAGG